MIPGVRRCRECGSDDLVTEGGTKTYRTIVGDKHVDFPASGLSWKRCRKCGEEFFGSDVLKVIQIAQMKALGLLSPKELKSFRLNLDMSQRQMADFLCVGAKTYLRWENGKSIQSKATDNYIRLVMKQMREIRPATGQVEAKLTMPTTIRFPNVSPASEACWQRLVSDTPADRFFLEMMPHAGNC